jgi:thioredoxin:protein disulfide reductase
MKIFNQLLVSSSLVALLATASADEPGPSKRLQAFGVGAGKLHDDFLAVDEAFDLTAKAKDARSVGLTWIIAPGYYLYRGKISVQPADSKVRLGAVELPQGQLKHDDYFGDTQVYYEVLDAKIPIKADAKKVSLRVTYQGCAEEGLCYNPVTKTLNVDLP